MAAEPGVLGRRFWCSLAEPELDKENESVDLGIITNKLVQSAVGGGCKNSPNPYACHHRNSQGWRNS